MRISARPITALVLAALYLVITMSPAMPLPVRSKTIAHALAGECTGECGSCGCTAEQKAGRTCCCWQRKLKHHHTRDEQAPQAGDCCKKKRTDTKTVMTCNCPCGSGKQLVFSASLKYELLPYHFAVEELPFLDDAEPHTLLRRLATRYAEPPDPPPKISTFA